jgi:hypothetical protein
MKSFSVVASAASAASVALVLVACSGSSGTDLTRADTSPTTPAPTASAPASDPPPPPPAPPPQQQDPAPPPPAGPCAGETTANACSQCCGSLHQDGAATYIGAVMACMCQDSTCNAACEPTLCNADNPRDPDGACNACIQSKAGSCATDIKTACTADADCVAFDQCIAESGCLSK